MTEKKRTREEVRKNSVCGFLFKMIIKTAFDHSGKNSNQADPKLNKFEKTPTLHQLICEQVTLETHCKQHNITRAQASKNIRTEILMLRGLVEGSKKKSIEV